MTQEKKKRLVKKAKAVGGLIFFLAAALSFSSPQKILAEEKVSLRVSPLAFDWTMNPGEEKTGSIQIENLSETDIEINVESADFFMDDGGSYFFPGESGSANTDKHKNFFMKEWIQAEEKNFLLPAGESALKNFSVRVPENAVLGGHYGAVFFRTSCVLKKDPNVVSSDQSSVCVSARPGVLLLTQIGGDARKNGKLKKAEIPTISFRDKENFNVEFSNDGNTHFRPEGSVTAKSITGAEFNLIDIKDKTILPGASRSFAGELNKKDFFGIYKIKGGIKDGEGKEMKFEKWTFLIPWKEILAIVGLVVFWWWFLKKFKVSKKKTRH